MSFQFYQEQQHEAHHNKRPFSSFSGVHTAATSASSSASPSADQYCLDPEPSPDPHPVPSQDTDPNRPAHPPPPSRILAILFLETFPDSTTPPLFSLLSLHRSLPTANEIAKAFWGAWPAHEFLGAEWEGERKQERFGRFTACGSLGGRWCAIRVVEKGVLD